MGMWITLISKMFKLGLCWQSSSLDYMFQLQVGSLVRELTSHIVRGPKKCKKLTLLKMKYSSGILASSYTQSQYHLQTTNMLPISLGSFEAVKKFCDLGGTCGVIFMREFKQSSTTLTYLVIQLGRILLQSAFWNKGGCANHPWNTVSASKSEHKELLIVSQL